MQRIGLQGLLASFFVFLSACSGTSNADGTGDGTTGGDPSTGTGTGTLAGGDTTGTGSSGTSSGPGAGAGGGSMSTGAGGAASTDDGGAAIACTTDPNLANAKGCWVGCDPDSALDNPQGLQGAFYTYGDGSSCALTNPPCTPMGVCVSGSTVVDPTYAKFGCGIGLELNSTGGMMSVKKAYTGPTKCFNYTLSGSSGGNEVRMSFTQSADTTGKVSPYVSIPSISGSKMGTVCLGDVSCQGQAKCSLTGSVFDLQIGVVGGNRAAQYNLCLTSLVPVGTGQSTFSQICGKPGAADGTEDVGKYFAQNNLNNDPSGSLCITPGLSGDVASFTIDSSNLHDPGNAPAAFPSIVDGWHYGRNSSDPKLPKQISALTTVTASVNFSGSNGKYDAAYDMWVLPTNNMAVTSPAGGMEVMVWLNYAGVQPSGNKVGTYNGYDVWTGNVSSWKYVAYVKQGPTPLPTDLAPFIKDAVSRQGVPTTSYLAGIEFGFELWQNGTGLKVGSFSTSVN
jgi:hypothetical protein